METITAIISVWEAKFTFRIPKDTYSSITVPNSLYIHLFLSTNLLTLFITSVLNSTKQNKFIVNKKKKSEFKHKALYWVSMWFSQTFLRGAENLSSARYKTANKLNFIPHAFISH